MSGMGSLDVDFQMATQDLDMDFLEDFLPVSDSFLNSYLQQLETNATQQVAGPSGVLNTSSLNGNAPIHSYEDTTYVNREFPLEGSGSGEGARPAVPAVPAAAAAPPPMRLYTQNVEPTVGMQPDAFARSLDGSASGTHDRNAVISTASWDKVDQLSGGQHGSDGDGLHTEGQSNGSNGRKRRDSGKRVRTSIQQQQNKLAQQRYREKRKQKNYELEHKVEQLVAQLNALQEVQGQAAQLSGENTALRNQVTKQQQIIEDLRLELKSMAIASDGACNAPPACEEACASACGSTCNDAAQARKEELARRMKATTPEEALKQFGELVSCIQNALATKGLPADTFMPGDNRYDDPALKTELARLVGETCLNCMHLFLSRTICPVEKCDTTHPERFTMIPDCAGTKAKWTACLDSVKLSSAQENMLLQQRQELLDSLRKVYYERNRLNLMAIGMMLPSPSQVLSPCFDPAPDAKIKCMEVNGALYCMRTEKQLNDVLDSLKLNLKAEQKLLMEINYKFVHKVLEPAQAAVLMVAAYPSNIDVLALANLLAYRRIHGVDGAKTDAPDVSNTTIADLPLASVFNATPVAAQ